MDLGRSRDSELTRRILNLLARVKNGTAQPLASVRRLVIREERPDRLSQSRLKLNGSKHPQTTFACTRGKNRIFSGETISRIAERLDPDHFIRIHRSTIVDVRKIKELIPVNSGEYIVVLKNGKSFPAAADTARHCRM